MPHRPGVLGAAASVMPCQSSPRPASRPCAAPGPRRRRPAWRRAGRAAGRADHAPSRAPRRRRRSSIQGMPPTTSAPRRTASLTVPRSRVAEQAVLREGHHPHVDQAAELLTQRQQRLQPGEPARRSMSANACTARTPCRTRPKHRTGRSRTDRAVWPVLTAAAVSMAPRGAGMASPVYSESAAGPASSACRPCPGAGGRPRTAR